ncbi:MAG: hypothetical protein M1837_005066 [Sclerophora amabilis]|nr:MAG: hypothetical protein M1837_005066 [Sclerophora amabilis]
MAPVLGSVFFPALDQCLDETRLLISWRAAFVGLSSPSSTGRAEPTLRRFLSDPSVVDLLGRPHHSFQSPTQETRSSFETRTAAINVTPNAQGKYDIGQIKEDALWLSKEVNIDEVSALRIAVVDWQSRSSWELLGSLAEQGSSVADDVTAKRPLDASIYLPRSSVLPGPSAGDRPLTDFNSTGSRRTRLIESYLSDRRYILKVRELLIRAGLSGETPPTATKATRTNNGKGKHKTSWIAEIGKTILNTRIFVGGSGSNSQSFLIECIEGLQNRVIGLEEGSGWFKADGERLDIESKWGTNLIVEMIHILQIIFHVADSSIDIPSAKLLIRWLQFMTRCQFFAKFELPFTSQRALMLPFKSLIAIVSLTIFKLSLSLEHILEFSDVPADSIREAEGPFFLEPTAMETITDLLTNAASECYVTASPTVFAWCIILQTVRESVLSKRDRESRDTIDSLSDADTSETEGGDSSNTENGSERYTRRRSPDVNTYNQATLFDQTLDKILLMSGDDDPIGYLAKSAVNGSQVFEVISNLSTKAYLPYGAENDGQIGRSMRLVLLELVRSSLDLVDYLPEVVNAVLSITIGGETYWDYVDRSSNYEGPDPASTILADDAILGPRLLEVAFGRFPYEQMPLLRMIRSLGTCNEFLQGSNQLYSTALLETMGSFTQTLPEGFRSYDTIREEENANQIVLTSDLKIFTDRDLKTRSMLQRTGEETALVLIGDGSLGDGIKIPAGTSGRVLLESDPLVVQWDYQYSGLKFLGRLLESSLPNSRLILNVVDIENHRDSVAEAVGVFAVLLSSTGKATKSDQGESETEKVLAEASDGLERNSDIISVIFDILENEVQQQQFEQGTETSLDLLINCMHFVFGLISVMPGRVWPFLARSSLLEIDGRGGRIMAVVASAEIVTGHFDFLISSIRIFEALVKDAVDHAVARKCASKNPKRFQSYDSLGTGIPEKIMAKILLAFARPMMDILESSSSWRLRVLDEGLDISSRIIRIFNSIIECTYGVDDSTKPGKKLTCALAPSAEYLVDAFLSSSRNNLVTQAITKILEEGLHTPLSTIFVGTMQCWTSRVREALAFSTTLILASNLLKLPASSFETQLFNITPRLVRLYVAHESYRYRTILLLDAIVSRVASWKEDPPSLLGHIGPETAKLFLSVLSRLDKPLDDEELATAIWNFLTSIVSNRQQWFAVYLLLGSAPRESIRKNNNPPTPSSPTKPMLAQALDSFSNFSEMPAGKALAILEFIALSEDHWSWAMSDLRKHPRFLTSLVDFVSNLEIKATQNDLSRTVADCQKIRMAAYIAEILAMYLHQSRQLGDKSLAKSLLPKLTFYANNAVAVPRYNASLHANLRRNFEVKFPGCTLSNFKRTRLQRRQFGRDFVYDTQLADTMLEFDRSWSGFRGPGLAEEVKRANVNLSLVQSQVTLLHSWKLLAIELSNTFPQEPMLQKTFAKVINDCLVSNSTTTVPETIFDNLISVRSDFAFILMQRLAEARSKEPEVKSLLKPIWNTIRASGSNFELALAGGDASYYRALLRILFLGLRAHLNPESSRPQPASPLGAGQSQSRQQSKHHPPQTSSETLRIVVEILDLILSRSFRDLASAIHEHSESASPEDVALLTAILQTSLRIPGIEISYPHLRDIVGESATARVATTLFSWSDQLAISSTSTGNGNNDNRDPVYGELAMLFLLELSSIPQVAEQLAVDGILGHLSAANLMACFRRGVRPFDRHNHRLYSIWTRGLLPLCLNLLHTIGPQIASEVPSFLNQFPAQLTISSQSLDSKPFPSAEDPLAGCLTLSTVSEAHSIALINRILEGFRIAGAGIGVLPSEIPKLQGWDAGSVKEDVEFWLQGRRVLKERIVPVGERESEMLSTKPVVSGAGYENRLEEKVVAELTAIAGLVGE